MAAPFQLPRFQFSLRWLFIALTVAAVLIGLTAIAANWMDALFYRPLVLLLVPACLIVTATCARGELRAFALGGLWPYVVLLANSLPRFGPLGSIWTLIHVAGCGLAGWGTYRWLRRRGFLGDAHD